MARLSVARLAAILVAIAVLTGPVDAGHYAQTGVAAGAAQPAGPRDQAPLTILQINDVYATTPIDGPNGPGGLARVATLKRQLAAAGRTPLMILAGDFLSPSVASSVFKGEQMVAALNAAGLDLATLGNHEFDFGTDVLLQRMRESRFQYVVSNVIDTATGKPVGGAAPYLVERFGPLRVGFIGLCLNTSEIAKDRLQHLRIDDPVATAGKLLPVLARERAAIIVAITHLDFATDRQLAARFPAIDLIVGGHEHYPITAVENRTLISKAGSDARWVARIDLNRRPPRLAERFYELIPITPAIADDADTLKVVNRYESRLGHELDVVVGTTSVPLDAETTSSRSAETNLGDLSADAMREHVGSDVAIVNSGGIRGDRLYPAGPLTRRTLLAIHPFGNVLCKIELPGAVLLRALEHGVSKLPVSAGQFPQVSGLTMVIDAKANAGGRVHDVRVNGARLAPSSRYTLALPDYVLKGGDGYDMFAGQRVIVGPETGDLMVTALEQYIAARGAIAPRTDGRMRIEN